MSDEKSTVRCPSCGAEISPTLGAKAMLAQRTRNVGGGHRPLKKGPVSRVTLWRRRKKAEREAAARAAAQKPGGRT